MEITVNGEIKEVGPETFVADYIEGLGLHLDTVVVEYNGQILLKEKYNTQKLEPGCVLELIRFIGGGAHA